MKSWNFEKWWFLLNTARNYTYRCKRVHFVYYLLFAHRCFVTECVNSSIKTTLYSKFYRRMVERWHAFFSLHFHLFIYNSLLFCFFFSVLFYCVTCDRLTWRLCMKSNLFLFHRFCCWFFFIRLLLFCIQLFHLV